MLGCLRDLWIVALGLIFLGILIFGFSILVIVIFGGLLIIGIISLFIPDKKDESQKNSNMRPSRSRQKRSS
jgi:hypothetical protein